MRPQMPHHCQSLPVIANKNGGREQSHSPENVFVGATGFEPAAAWSQTRSATGLRYTPKDFLKTPALMQLMPLRF